MMEPLYCVPVIAHDLRQEDNLTQVADALEHLSWVVDNVLGRVNARVDVGADKVAALAARVAVCSQKVDRLSSSDRATQVLCDPKYPAMACNVSLQSVFAASEGEEKLLQRTAGDIGRPGLSTEKELQDKMEFYHVKVSNSEWPWRLLTVPDPTGALGPPPARLGSAVSLLLHGSATPAYSALGQRPPALTPADKARAVKAEDPPRGMDAPPVSLARRDRTRKPADAYMYSPGMGEVPEMDVPKDLPHLPGVAGDMQFMSETGPAIAPSAAMTPQTEHSQLTEPPIIVQPTEPIKTEPLSDVKKTEDVMVVPKVEAVAIPMKVEALAQPTAGIAPVSGGAPPPPPPPPPPSPPVAEGASEPDSVAAAIIQKPLSKKPEKKLVGGGAEGHANLMEAIRKAGGSGKAKLRSSINTEPQEGKKPSSSGGDLMADLHAKLQMRRKGISGTRPEGTILAAISAMVPPPAPGAPSESGSSSPEEDWD